jgi:hypothetical protein
MTEIGFGERTLCSGTLGPRAAFTLLINGQWRRREIETLIELLRLQANSFADYPANAKEQP